MLLFATFLLANLILAGEHGISEVGVTLTVPDHWIHDEGDSFGYVIRPPGGKPHRVKMRIHKLGYVDLTPEQALKKGLERMNARKAKLEMAAETLESSEPVTTAGGLKGQRGVIGPGVFYLDRYYFTHPSGGMFCVCVYKNSKEPGFGKDCEEIIKRTLRVLGP